MSLKCVYCRVVKILQATKKIVSGELYTFRVALKKDAADVICEFKVWEQSWMLNGRDVEVKCDNENVYKLTQNPVNMRSKKQYCLSP